MSKDNYKIKKGSNSMARFNTETADKYGRQGGAGYFSLKNDKDVARVRFMYNSIGRLFS